MSSPISARSCDRRAHPYLQHKVLRKEYQRMAGVREAAVKLHGIDSPMVAAIDRRTQEQAMSRCLRKHTWRQMPATATVIRAIYASDAVSDDDKAWCKTALLEIARLKGRRR